MTEPAPGNDEATGSSRNSRATLERLLTEMIEQPERRAELTTRIEEVFGQEKAVMVLDMSGFSRTTQRHGIVSFLLMIHQMRLLIEPCVAEYKGVVLKAEADNLFCLFDSVEEAVQASKEIAERLEAAKVVLPGDRRLYVAIGIGYGHILNIEDEDLYGSEVNLASKLGEDIAEMGQILLTTAAHEQVKEDAGIESSEEAVSISGLELPYYVMAQG